MRRPLAFAANRLRAFTLIELLVVIVILGILMAVAVPTFLRQQSKAQDSRTQQFLTTAYKAIRSGTPDTGNQYPTATSMVSWVQQSEPELTVQRASCYTATASTDAILVDPSSSANSLLLCARSASGNVWELSATATSAPTLINGTLVPLTFSGNEITDAVRAAGVQGDGLSAQSAVGVWESTTNLVENSDLSSGALTDWYVNNSSGPPASDGAVQAISASGAPVGSGGAIRYTITTKGGWGSYFANRLYSYWGQTFDTSNQYTLSFWARQAAGNPGTPTVQITDGDSSNVVLSSKTFTPTSSWQRFSFTFTPASTGNQPVIFFASGGLTAVPAQIDITGLQLEKKPEVTPYVPTTPSASATRATANVQLSAATAGLTSSTQMWFAERFSMNTANNDTGIQYIGYLSVPGGWSLQLYRGQGGPNRVWEMQQSSGQGIGWVDNSAPAGNVHTVIGYVTATTIAISLDGGAFKTAARTTGTGLVPTTLYVGTTNGSNPLDGNVYWFATGTGTLTDSDAATINALGNTDPTRANFPSAAQVTLTWDGTSPTGSLK